MLATIAVVDRRRRQRPVLAVTCHRTIVPRKPDAPDDPESVPAITVEALNIGTRPVEVRRAGFVLANGEEVSVGPYTVEPDRPPHLVNDGESIRFHYRLDSEIPATQRAEVARAFVEGGRGRQWEGEPDAWLQPLRVSKLWWRRSGLAA